ncbi:MAG: hypothetical protein ACJ71W_17480 [Terriglobales bacterium]
MSEITILKWRFGFMTVAWLIAVVIIIMQWRQNKRLEDALAKIRVVAEQELKIVHDMAGTLNIVGQKCGWTPPEVCSFCNGPYKDCHGKCLAACKARSFPFPEMPLIPELPK